MTRLAIVLAMLTALIAGAGADAHTRSESHGAWRIDGRSVHLSFAMSDGEAQRIVPSASRPSEQRGQCDSAELEKTVLSPIFVVTFLGIGSGIERPGFRRPRRPDASSDRTRPAR